MKDEGCSRRVARRAERIAANLEASRSRIASAYDRRQYDGSQREEQ